MERSDHDSDDNLTEHCDEAENLTSSITVSIDAKEVSRKIDD